VDETADLLPHRQSRLCAGARDRDELHCDLRRRVRRRFCQEDTTVIRTAEIAPQREHVVDDVSLPPRPDMVHRLTRFRAHGAHYNEQRAWDSVTRSMTVMSNVMSLCSATSFEADLSKRRPGGRHDLLASSIVCAESYRGPASLGKTR
jgi:hypothetical protein